MMLYQASYVICILFVWSIVDVRTSSAPYDIRINDHKVDSTRDLIINTPRPNFSWKISMSNNCTQRNIEQTGYQIQLEAMKLTDRDTFYQWDSQQVVSSQSIDVSYTSQIDLVPSRYYRVRIRIWTTNSQQVRQEFNVPSTSSIKSAIVYISGLGYYEFLFEWKKC